MLVFPNAKINIGLAVKGKRSDGYHNIESIFYPLNIYDALECVENKLYILGDEKFQWSCSGLSIAGPLETNLVYQAYKILDDIYSLPAIKCHLHKHIPMGAGLGGGSSDGAYMLKLLNDLFQLDISENELEKFALQLGSDCPFFIRNQPMLVKGRGELMAPIDFNLKGYTFVLIYPDLHIGTKEAYENLIYHQEALSSFENLIHLPLPQWKNNIYNDFEGYAFKKFPQIEKYKDQLYESGAVYASMTGSGSAVYGIFESTPNQQILKTFTGVVFTGNI